MRQPVIILFVSIFLILSGLLWFIYFKLVHKPEPSRRFLISETNSSIALRLKDSSEMVLIPEGFFLMGRNPFWWDGQNNRILYQRSQSPIHEIYLPDYWIDRNEVTVSMFKQFVEETGYVFKSEVISGSYTPKNLPIIYVTWEDACAYCNWAGARLPTEAEWEKAAKGTDQRQYPWGNKFNKKYLNSSGSNAMDYSTGFDFLDPVGSYPEGMSPYGLYDMSGNVWEWTTDWYCDKYYKRSPDSIPKGPVEGTMKVIRGGSWDEDSRLTTTIRNKKSPYERDNNLGFRCALSISDTIRYVVRKH